MFIIKIFKNLITDLRNSMQICEKLFVETRFSISFSIFDFEINDLQIEILRTQMFNLLSKSSKTSLKDVKKKSFF